MSNQNKTNSSAQILESIKCSSPLFPNNFGQVVSVSEDAKINEAFTKMTSHKIMAIPVTEVGSMKIVGIISMLDMIAFVLADLHTFDFIKEIDEFTGLHAKLAVNNESVATLLKKTGMELDAPCIIEESENLYTAAKMMLMNHSHRIIVYNSEGELTNIITQSRILQLLTIAVDALPVAQKPLEELNVRKKIVSVRDNDLTYTAFKKMKRERITGCAVVNKEGELVGNVSINDFKLLGDKLRFFGLLGLPVSQYLKELDTDQVNIRSELLTRFYQDSGRHNSKAPVVVSVSIKNTLMYAIKMIQFYRIHRIWVVDDHNKPVGVLSLSDIIALLVGPFEKV